MSKTFSIKEMIDWNGKIAADRGNDMDDAFDRPFSLQMKARYDTYGPKTFISDRQHRQIDRIFRITGGLSAPEPVKQDSKGFDDPNSDDIPF